MHTNNKKVSCFEHNVNTLFDNSFINIMQEMSTNNIYVDSTIHYRNIHFFGLYVTSNEKKITKEMMTNDCTTSI